ncbi:MAG: FG-GAP repeat protein [Polyangiaceae bacterium]
MASASVERVELPHFKAKDATVVYGMSAAADLDGDGYLDLVLAAGVPVELGVMRKRRARSVQPELISSVPR